MHRSLLECLDSSYIDEVLTKRVPDDTQLADANTDPDNYYYHQDDLFSVLAITDDTGAVIERYTYSDYGEFRITDALDAEVTASAIDNIHTYTGRLIDTDTGLYAYRHRWMAAPLGRFVQRDPLGFIDSMNLQVLCLSNAIKYVDPYGLQATDCDNLQPAKPVFFIEEDGITWICDVECAQPFIDRAQSLANQEYSSMQEKLGYLERKAEQIKYDYEIKKEAIEQLQLALLAKAGASTAVEMTTCLIWLALPPPLGYAPAAKCAAVSAGKLILKQAAIRASMGLLKEGLRRQVEQAVREIEREQQRIVDMTEFAIEKISDRAKDQIISSCCGIP